MLLDKQFKIMKELNLATRGLRPINVDEMTYCIGSNNVKDGRDRMCGGGKSIERDMQWILGDGNTPQRSF